MSGPCSPLDLYFQMFFVKPELNYIPFQTKFSEQLFTDLLHFT